MQTLTTIEFVTRLAVGLGCGALIGAERNGAPGWRGCAPTHWSPPARRCSSSIPANHGKTWTTVSRYFIFSSKAPATVWAFTAIHPDGTGRIARACVALGAGKPYCTAAW